MRKVTDLNILKREDLEFFTDKGKITKFELYGMTLIAIVSLVNSGKLFYQEL